MLASESRTLLSGILQLSPAQIAATPSSSVKLASSALLFESFSDPSELAGDDVMGALRATVALMLAVMSTVCDGPRQRRREPHAGYRSARGDAADGDS
jgi:hypothetical protein